MADKRVVTIEGSTMNAANLSYFLNELIGDMQPEVKEENNSTLVTYLANGEDPARIHLILEKMTKGKIFWRI